MKQYWKAFVMCQSMFCAIPCPWKAWDEKARPLMLLFLPLVGLEIGFIWAAIAVMAAVLPVPSLLAGALICLCPFFMTGFIHLDGFMDVTDAVKSWRDLERRREILKDSRVGAFAVINVVCLMIMQFAAGASIAGSLAEAAGSGAQDGIYGAGGGNLAAAFETCVPVFVMLLLIPMVSRCCSGLAVTALPAMETSQYADADEKSVGQIVVYVILIVLAIAVAFITTDRYGLVILGCMAGYALALRRAYKSLKGMNGDISGYALTIGEMCGLIVLALL